MSPKNKKSLLIATFLRLGIVASSPDRRLRSESAAKWLYCGSFPLCGSEGESPIAKKLQKARYFCFCDWLIVAMGQTLPMMNRIRTEIRACTCRATKNRPKAVSFSNIWLGQQDSRALRALSPLAQAPAGKSLKACHRHVFFTGFHLIGSNPLHPARQQKNRPKAVSFSNIWLGQQDSNLHNWYQKPGSCHWTMAQRMP